MLFRSAVVVIGPVWEGVVTATVAGTLVKVPVHNAPKGQQATLPALSKVQIAFVAQQAEPAPGRLRKEQLCKFGPQGLLFCLLSRRGSSLNVRANIARENGHV